jgi:two-component system LytT family sensor kinase
MQAPAFSNKRMYLFIILLWVIWATLQAWALAWSGFPFQTAIIDSAVSNGLLMIIGLSIRNVLRYYRPGKGRFFYLFAWNFCIAAIWVGVVKWALSQLLTDPTYLAFLYKSLPVRFFIAFLMTGWMALIHWLLFTFEENRENEKRKADADKLSKDAELYKLRQQLQPHFLFNSLNSISSLTGSRPEEARHMIQQLADFLRGTLKNDEKMLVSLEEELHYLQLYLDIEKVRFGHRLSTEVKHDETSINDQVPQMLLQPIVENAIKFGLYDTTGTVTITIDTKSINGNLILTIQNPFDPQTSQSRSGTGFGLSSIQRRLYLLYARKDLIETKAENNLFTTTVTIPQIHD